MLNERLTHFVTMVFDKVDSDHAITWDQCEQELLVTLSSSMVLCDLGGVLVCVCVCVCVLSHLRMLSGCLIHLI